MVVAFGVVFAYPVIDGYVRSTMPADLPALHNLHVLLATKVVTPATTVVLLAGLYLATDRWNLDDPWISATLAILVVLFGLTGAVLTPADRKLAQLAERDTSSGAGPSAEYDAARRRATPSAASRCCSSSSRSSSWSPSPARSGRERVSDLRV